MIKANQKSRNKTIFLLTVTIEALLYDAMSKNLCLLSTKKSKPSCLMFTQNRKSSEKISIGKRPALPAPPPSKKMKINEKSTKEVLMPIFSPSETLMPKTSLNIVSVRRDHEFIVKNFGIKIKPIYKQESLQRLFRL
ncbi:hypothetical protein SteCoe_2562 [Stentor coeruleus]|uniref:Uncharacterized protein n=1 Tax=Stentor coeruleus TaxID=5963 RepID=A0A1R2CIX1_9CILI|nr:hypothetical protein SteCoe_9103 [Stentor coeruleus]OMJ94357.1 hypothetical protein SteCoe_2562 [Stentor coeruleus]